MSTSLATRAMPDGFHMTLYSVKCTGACTRTPSRYRLMVASTTTMLAGHHFSLQYAHLSVPKFRYVRIWKSRLPGTCRHCAIFSKAWLGVPMDIHGKQRVYIYKYILIFIDGSFYQYLEVFEYFIRIYRTIYVCFDSNNLVLISSSYFFKMDTQTVSTYLSRHTWNLLVCAGTEKTKKLRLSEMVACKVAAAVSMP